jgi:HSP20 family molecular chaperone IbpA
MKLFDNKFVLVGGAFLVGALFSYSMISLESAKSSPQDSSIVMQNTRRQKRKPRARRRQKVDDINKRQQQMMNQMMKVFDQSLSMDISIDSSMGFSGNSLKVTKYSDDKFRYIKVKATDIDEKSLKVKISDGRIDISGEIRKEEGSSGVSGSSTSSYVSSFSRSFDVPNFVKEETARITVVKGDILIRFDKE